ncbi:MAG: VWA-like domain-containing protein [Campylobacterota bacterium]|nr:VWA-like domain-containing protein [Campylobacterota bacterium]
MSINKDYLYSIETIESIVANPDSNWKTLFKEMIISMIASNKNELLWYANFLSRCEYEFHFNETFTSAVYFNGKNFVIVVNPAILGVIHKDQIIAILKHSAGHIINHHFSRGNFDESIDKKIIETAKDIVINGNRELPYIKDLPRTGNYKDSLIQTIFYQSLTEMYKIEEYEVGREFEYYIELMIEAQEEEETEENDQSCSNDLENDDDETDIELSFPQNLDEESESSENGDEEDSEGDGNTEQDSSEENGEEPSSLSEKTLEALEKGECSIDSHEFGEQLQDSVGLDNNLLESFMDSTLKEMINDSTGFARGFTPGDAMEALQKIEKRKSHKDWKKIFNKKMRNYLTNSLRYREPNKSRQHPIYPDDLDLYGYSPGKKPKLGVVLDVSGSVDDKLLSAFMSEVQAIQRKYSIKNVTLVQVDAEIKSIEKFGVRDKFIIRHGGGGTVMEPGFSALLRQSSREIPDLIICATDGDIEERFEHVKVPSKVQVVWLVSKEGKLRFDTSQYSKHQMDVIDFSV